MKAFNMNTDYIGIGDVDEIDYELTEEQLAQLERDRKRAGYISEEEAEERDREWAEYQAWLAEQE